MSPAPPNNFADSTARPHLKITGLRIRNLRPIAQLNLPEDGISWNEHFPDLCVIAGNNGSGKTTLLEFLYWVFHTLSTPRQRTLALFDGFPKRWLGAHAEIDLLVNFPGQTPTEIKLIAKTELSGMDIFKDANSEFLIIYPRNEQSRWSLTEGPAVGVDSNGQIAEKLYQQITQGKVPSGIVYIPSGTRAVTAGTKDDKRGGPMGEQTDFAHKWYRPEQWKHSLEALLWSARWEDMNATQNGHPEEATHFSIFAAAFDRFFGKTKTLKWSNRGELFVEIAGSKEQHGLDMLSAGEQQMLVLMGDLMYRWLPGSIILIDEPELHFHSAWQGYFWEFLREMLRERGGQVLLASQSPELFRAAELGERLILGM